MMNLSLIDRPVARLQATFGTAPLFAILLPILLLKLFPTGYNGNEYGFFMLAFRRVSPESFSPFSAAFDASNARIVSEYIVGYPIAWFGYDAAHAMLRIAMACAYAAVIAYFFSGLGLSVAGGAITIGAYLVLGPDLLGNDWLFDGVETKTLAYAFVFFGLGAMLRGRRAYAVGALIFATYMHFLVGGFWLLGILALDAFRGWNAKRSLKLLAVYVLATSPLIAVILYDQIIAQTGTGTSAGGPSTDYIYSILRNPHHVAPFSSLSQLHAWSGDMTATVALTLAFAVLMQYVQPEQKLLFRWLLAILIYLVAAIIVSAADVGTGFFGKFYLFRPAALTLLLAIALTVLFFETARGGESTARVFGKAAFLFILPVAILGVADDRLTERFGVRQHDLTELRKADAFIRKNSQPDDIVLVDPAKEIELTDGEAPFFIDRPTLVSWKFVPTNPREIRRWYDLIKYRRRVFKGACDELARFPIRYLLVHRIGGRATAPCGEIVWESDLYALADVSALAKNPAGSARP